MFLEKHKSITGKLEKKFNEIKSLLPEELRKEADFSLYIAGGCIYSLYQDKPVNDYDFFCTSEYFAKQVMGYFRRNDVTMIKEVREGIWEGVYPLDGRMIDIVVTNNAVSFGQELQIITKYTGSPDEVVGQFDFMHNMYYYEFGNTMISKVADSFDFLDDKYLKYNTDRARDICGTIMRIPKFVQKGFIVTKTEVAKMLKSLEDKGFDERELEILKERATISDHED